MLSALRFSVNNTLASTRQFNPCCAKVHSPADVCTTSAVQRSQQEWIRPTLGASKGCPLCHVTMMMMIMSSDVSWHIRDKLWPMPKHGSVILSLRPRKPEGSLGRPPRLSHSSWTMLTIQKGVPLLTEARQVFVFIQVTLWGVHKMETYLSSLVSRFGLAVRR